MPTKNYASIQILRGAAALLVVVFHAGVMTGDRFGAVGQHLLLRAGAAGVDIFFPISGFVMVVSTTSMLGRPEAWRVFLERRLVRIVPLYWLATTLKLVMLITVPGLALHAALTLHHTLGSYLFLFTPNPNGGTMPLVPVGWTLNYEMFFYAVFAATLFFQAPLVRTVGVVMVAAAAIGLLHLSTWPPLEVCSAIVLEFVAGMIIARLTLAGFRLKTVPALIVGAIALVSLVGTDALPEAVVDSGRVLYWGLPGAALVLAAVSLEAPLQGEAWSLPRRLGDASYSIYLSHGFVIPVFGVVVAKLVPASIGAVLFAFTAAVVLSALVGLLVYDWVEQPILRLRPKKPSRPAVVPASPSAATAVAALSEATETDLIAP